MPGAGGGGAKLVDGKGGEKGDEVAMQFDKGRSQPRSEFYHPQGCKSGELRREGKLTG